MVKSPRSTSGSPTDESQFRAWLEAFVASRTRRGSDGLSHARHFFETLGSPQNRVPAVHVVGTAGKGTVCHLVTRRLVDSGLTVATHMSPHVYDPRERFMINGKLPQWPDVADAVDEVASAVEQTRQSTGQAPSYFAVTSALSWVIGRAADTDVLVVEAGIGGRYDATNVIDRSDRVVVVTAVGLDHTDVLGSTVREIAGEKVAVIPGSAGVVMAPQADPNVVEIVAGAARMAKAELVVPGELSGDWRLDCDGAASAVELMLTGRSTPTRMPWQLPPGRLEMIESAGRTFVLDGAHNPIKLRGLDDTLRLDRIGPVRCVIAAVGRGKDLQPCAEAFARFAPLVITTEFDADPAGSGSAPRCRSAPETAAAIAESSPTTQVLTVADPRQAVSVALDNTGDGDIVVVTGSFMHLAAAREAIRELSVS